jgi:hypothetical protein
MGHVEPPGLAGGLAVAFVDLARGCFDHVQWRRGWNDPSEVVAGLLEERAVLSLCALASAQHEDERSRIFPGLGALPRGRASSATSSLPPSTVALRQLRRIATQCSSSQLWR